jgi:branched-chain amino acid transport system substrate-binding protein
VKSRVKSWIAAFGSAVLTLALAGCAADRVAPPPAAVQPLPEAELPEELRELRVGLLLPLSGPAADLGQDMLQAAQMALFDVGPNDVVLLPRDTRGTAEGARAATAEVIAEGASLILGPLFHQAVSAATPIAREAGVSVIAFSNVSAVAENGTWVMGFRPEEQVERVVRHALEQGLERIAGLAPDDAYGRTAMQALRRAVVQGGGELGQTLFYPPDLADPSPVVRRIAAYDERRAELERERQRLQQLGDAASLQALARLATRDTTGDLPFDAILLADGSDRLRSVGSLLTFYDVDPADVRFLGTMRWQDDPRVYEEPALQRGWFAAPAPDTMAAFAARFESVFGHPPQQLAALAYDATALAVTVARDLQDEDFTLPTLTIADGFAGATGLFRLRVDGLAEHGLAVLEIAGRETQVIDPAPQTFIDVVVMR